jgi:hypothetical protein
VVLERNSRDYEERCARTSRTAWRLAEWLRSQPTISAVYYPGVNLPETGERFDSLCRHVRGGVNTAGRGCLLSIDTHGPDSDGAGGAMLGSYAWAGPDWHRHMNPDMAITGAVIACDNPEVIAMRWSTLLVRPWHKLEDRWRLQLNHGSIDFTAISDGRGEGLSAIRIAGLGAPMQLSGLDLLPEESA